DLLHLCPPPRPIGRGEAEIGPQQQQVVGRPESRVSQEPQRPPPARMLETRLQSEHLAQPERETPGNREMRLRLSHRAVTGLTDRGQLMPFLRRHRLDDLCDWAIKKECQQKCG